MWLQPCLTFVLFFNIINIVLSEFLTVSLIGSAILAAGGLYKWDTLKDKTICRYVECCNADYIPYDVKKLKQALSEKMYGQPLANELVNIISAHKDSVNGNTKKNKKALVISLHGWSGVGKSYAAIMIAEALYKNGMNSKYVKLFMGSTDFDCTDIQRSKKELMEKVNNAVKMCPTSLIIFNEVHDMCASLLDSIKPMLDHHHSVDNVDYRDSIFLFISNIGGQEISTSLLDLYSQGVKRNEVEFHHFEPIIRNRAFHTGGFMKSSTIAQHLIDHYIPFLPLEQTHVEMCALTEFRERGIYNPDQDMMEDAMSVITFGPTEEQPIFASNGCKRFAKQIPYVIEKYKKKTEL